MEALRELTRAPMERAAAAVMDDHLRGFASRLSSALREAQRSADVVAIEVGADGSLRRADDDPGTYAVEYGPVDLEAVLGDLDGQVQDWMDALSPDWLDGWERAAASALDGLDAAGVVPVPPRSPAVLARLEESAAAAADYSREEVRRITVEGIDSGSTIAEITWELRQSQAFGPVRALRIARTESVRAQSAGELDRWSEAADLGIELDQEWMSASDRAVRDSHAIMDGQVVPVGSDFKLPSGVMTPGPGLSGVPEEDINCRCGRKVREREPKDSQ